MCGAKNRSNIKNDKMNISCVCAPGCAPLRAAAAGAAPVYVDLARGYSRIHFIQLCSGSKCVTVDVCESATRSAAFAYRPAGTSCGQWSELRG